MASKTEEVTVRGRPVWKDEETGESFSEKTVTIPFGDGWVVAPTVKEDGSQYNEDELQEVIKSKMAETSSGKPVDFITGEELPVFEDLQEADRYAQWRSDTMFDKEAADKGFDFKELVIEEPAEKTAKEPEGFIDTTIDFLDWVVTPSRHKFAEGGMAMEEQMSEAMGVDPVSGNEVPPGAMPEEVRDDIPAQLSEGEYVIPADVVRYFGVRFFEDLRNEAKMGWMQMEQDGRIGGEPIGMDEELPFDISELQVEDDMAEEQMALPLE